MATNSISGINFPAVNILLRTIDSRSPTMFITVSETTIAVMTAARQNTVVDGGQKYSRFTRNTSHKNARPDSRVNHINQPIRNPAEDRMRRGHIDMDHLFR